MFVLVLILINSKKDLDSNSNTTVSLVDSSYRTNNKMDKGAPSSSNNNLQTWRYWMFGDSSGRRFRFVEKAIERAPKEVGCAFAASSLVSPLVSIIDKCLVQDIASPGHFLESVGKASKEMVFAPRAFFGGLSFRFTWFVYFGTYAVVNLSELALDVNRIRRDEDRKRYKVGASSVANIGLLAWRDAVFAREFGSGKAPKSTPMRTIGLFAARDSTTMFATFYAAPEAARYLQKEHGVERNTAELSMALGIPVIAQFLTAPLHIHALDYFNRRQATMAERMSTLKAEMGTVCFARGLRILPAFGIGSFSNNKFRELFIRQENADLLLSRRVTVMLETGRRRLTKQY